MSSIKSRKIIEEILDNFRAGADPLYEKIIVPETYWVYLNPNDYEAIKDKHQQIVGEAAKALSDEIFRVNEAVEAFEKGFLGRNISKFFDLFNHLSGIFRGQPLKRRYLKRKYAEPRQKWQIHLNPDHENKCREGEILIKSIPSAGEGNELSGIPPKFLVTMRTGGKQIVAWEPAENRPDDETEVQTQRVIKPKPALNSSPAPFALIHLLSLPVKTTYKMTKNTFVIGRGNPTCWVDLPILHNSKISHEHLKINRDELTGKFFIKDLSSNGTQLNGKKLPSSIVKPDGLIHETEIQTPLPDHSKIVLADDITLEFEIVVQM